MRAVYTTISCVTLAAAFLMWLEAQAETRERDRLVRVLADTQARLADAEADLLAVDAEIAALIAEVAMYRAAMDSAKAERGRASVAERVDATFDDHAETLEIKWRPLILRESDGGIRGSATP